jgi:hypothetical protein
MSLQDVDDLNSLCDAIAHSFRKLQPLVINSSRLHWLFIWMAVFTGRNHVNYFLNELATVQAFHFSQWPASIYAEDTKQDSCKYMRATGSLEHK